MTVAELHGKLAPDQPDGAHERMEDLLTSDVFGTMKYAGWEHGFLHWLLKAEPAPIEPSPPPISTYLSLAKTTHVEYSFWPRLKNNREPDVALLFCFDSEDPLLILVEAKYLSGTSDWEGNEEADPSGRTGNQIADQVQGLQNMSEEDCLGWFQSSTAIERPNISCKLRRIHLFVTMHTVLPVRDYELSTRNLGGTWPIHSYWLSWTRLAECLKDHLDQPDKGLAALLGDLYKLLQRKGLLPFHGFNMEPWQIYPQIPSFWYERWWSLPPLRLSQYQSFWDQIFWHIQPIKSLPDGCFWERI